MPRKLTLSHLQKIALLVAYQDARGEYRYKPLRRLLFYSKSSVSRSARRLERAGLVTRQTHHTTITARGRAVVQRAMLKPHASWWTASQAISLYIQVANAIDKDTRAARRAASIVQEIVRRYKPTGYENHHSRMRFMVKREGEHGASNADQNERARRHRREWGYPLRMMRAKCPRYQLISNVATTFH